VGVRLSPEEARVLDAVRGPLSRSGWLRAQVRRKTESPTIAVSATPAPTNAQVTPARNPSSRFAVPTASKIVDVVDHKPNAAGTICTVCGWRMSKAPQSCPGKDG